MDGKSAPVNSSCKRCKNKVVNGVKCVECASSYHLSCAKLLNTITFVNDATIRCCDSAPAIDCDAVFFDAVEALTGSENKVDIAIFNYIIRQKDTIINELRGQITALNNHIDTLKSTTSVQQKEKTFKVQSAKSYQDKPGHERTEPETAKTSNMKGKQTIINQQENAIPTTGCQNKSNLIESAQVAVAVKEAVAQIKCKEYINLAREDKEKSSINNQGEWSKVVGKRRRKGPLVVGDSTESNFVTLKGVPKTVALHVYRLDPNTDQENLKEFLKPNFPEAICERITPKHPELYSSFKVTIYEDNFQKAMDSSKWPKNACISHFLDLSRRRVRNVN